MQEAVQLRQRVADEITEADTLISGAGELLKDTPPPTSRPQATAVTKAFSTGNPSLVHLDAHMRTLEASVTAGKQRVMQKIVEARICENVHELTETLESSQHRFVYATGEKLKALQQELPDLSSLYALVLSEQELVNSPIVFSPVLPKVYTSEELTVIRETVRETEDQIAALQESIGESLGKILHTNLYTDLVSKLVHVSEQEFYRLLLEKSQLLRSVSFLYNSGRRLETDYNKNCTGWISTSSESSQSCREKGNDKASLLGGFLSKDCSGETLERHSTLSAKLGQEYIMFSEECFHLSLYLRLFTARILTIVEQDKLSTVVSSDLSIVARQVCAAMRSFSNKLSAFANDNVVHFLNIYLGCASPILEHTERDYELVKPIFDDLFLSLSLTPNCIGYKVLAVDTMLQVFNAKYHIFKTLATLNDASGERDSNTSSFEVFDSHKKVAEGLEQARTILIQQYIVYLYASYQADTSLSNLSQIFLFSSDAFKLNPSLRISTTDESCASSESQPPGSKITRDLSTVLSSARSAITNAVCYQYSKRFTASECANLMHLFSAGVLRESKNKVDALVNLEACLRVFKYRDDYFLASMLSMHDFQDQLNVEQSYLGAQAIAIKRTLAAVEQEIRRELPSVGNGKGVISQFYQQLFAWEDNLQTAHTLYLASTISTISVYVHNYLSDRANKLLNPASTLHNPLSSKYAEMVGILDSIDALAEETSTRGMFYPDSPSRGQLKSIDTLYSSIEDDVQKTTDLIAEYSALIDRALIHIPILEDMIASEKATLDQTERSIATSLADSCINKDLLKTASNQDAPQMVSDSYLAPFMDIPILTNKLFTELDTLSTEFMASGAKGLSTLLSQSQEKLSELYAKHDAEIHLEKRKSVEQISEKVQKITQIAKEMNLSMRGTATPLYQLNLLLGDVLSIINASIERPSKEKYTLSTSVNSALTLLN